MMKYKKRDLEDCPMCVYQEKFEGADKQKIKKSLEEDYEMMRLILDTCDKNKFIPEMNDIKFEEGANGWDQLRAFIFNVSAIANMKLDEEIERQNATKH
jgi:hypothetical protein